MISITTTTVNLPVIIRDYKKDSRIKKAEARVSKNKLLDGTVSVIHSGFVEGDRTLSVKCLLKQEPSNLLWSFFKEATFITIAFDEGIFNGVIRALEVEGLSVTCRIELQSKLS